MSDVSKINKTLLRKMRRSDKKQAVGVIVLLKSLEQNRTDQQKQLSNSEEMLSFLQRLEELKREGESITYQPHEAFSSAYVRARPDVIMTLTDFEEVLEIIDNQAVTLIRPVETTVNS